MAGGKYSGDGGTTLGSSICNKLDKNVIKTHYYSINVLNGIP